MIHKYLRRFMLAGLGLSLAVLLTGCGGAAMGDMMDGMMGDGGMMGGMRSDSSEQSTHSHTSLVPLNSESLDVGAIYTPVQIHELPGRVGTDGVKEFEVVAAPQPVELAGGTVVEGWAYNGQTPGPLLRVREGERVRITFQNDVPGTKTALHWHGLPVPNAMGGVPPITQPPVRQGETFTYEFNAEPAGTFWYHAHSMGDNARQLDRGLLAPLVIEPREPTWEPKTDREWVVVLDEWKVQGGGRAPEPNDGAMMGGAMGDMMGSMMGSHLLGSADGYNVFTINGRVRPEEPFRARAGEWVHLRLLNGGFQQHRIHIHGMKAWVTRTDGHLLPSAQAVSRLVISPFERLDVFLYGEEPGDFSLHDHDPGHSEAGMEAKIRLEPVDDVHQVEDLPVSSGSKGAPTYQNLVAGVPGRDSTRYDRTYSMTLGVGMGGSGEWAINGKGWREAEPFPIRAGERIRLKVFNMTPESHPMHLHGHEFRVIEVNGEPLSEPWLLKDTLNIKPI